MHSKTSGLLLIFPIALQAQEELPVGPDSKGGGGAGAVPLADKI